MSLETVTDIDDLVVTNPTASDPKSQGDDHIRNLKTAMKNGFAGFTGSVIATGTDGGSANTYTVTPSHAVPAYASRMIVIFSPAANNTGASTINISGLGAKSLKSVAGAALTSGDLTTGNIYAASYDGTDFRLLSVTKNYVDQLSFSSALPAQSLGFLISNGASASFSKTATGFPINQVKGADIASAATIDLDAATGNLVHVTGTTTITAITLASGAERVVVFDGSLTLTHNATTLILPDGANIKTAAGDVAVFRGDGSGNVRCVSYRRAVRKGGDVASAATVDLDVATGDFVHITGTTTITAITLASGREADVVFDGALTLTHNSTTLILPGGANITTAAGDRATFRGDGSGNVRCIHYTRANGQSIAQSLVLLATLTPTAAANVDALSTFTSSYDNYRIIGEGITPASNDTLLMRVAEAGVASSSLDYYRGQAEASTTVTAASTSMAIAATVLAAGKGCNFVLDVLNVNSTSGLKSVAGKATWHSTSAPGYVMNGAHCTYAGATVVTGVSFLWNGGVNFSATGKIRIYGYNNT